MFKMDSEAMRLLDPYIGFGGDGGRVVGGCGGYNSCGYTHKR